MEHVRKGWTLMIGIPSMGLAALLSVRGHLAATKMHVSEQHPLTASPLPLRLLWTHDLSYAKSLTKEPGPNSVWR
jgi:hypothetical protein